MKLRSIYNGNIVAGYIPGAEPKGELKEDVYKRQQRTEGYVLSMAHSTKG